MSKLLLSVHVLAAIVFIGPVTVAVSLFPRYGRLAFAGNEDATGAVPVVHLLHRISRVYAVLGLAVPAFGLATAVSLGVLSDAWLLVSIGLTLLAGGLLALAVLPEQAAVRAAVDRLTGPPADSAEPRSAGAQTSLRTRDRAGLLIESAQVRTAALRRLAMTSGVFALLWAVVVLLMVVRPGSTTGV